MENWKITFKKSENNLHKNNSKLHKYKLKKSKEIYTLKLDAFIVFK